jgi:hypothetical protein
MRYPLLSSDVNEILFFSTGFRTKSSNNKFYENHEVGVKLFHADGRTDMTKFILAYRNFENAPNIDLSRIKHKHYRNTYNANTRFYFYSVSIHVYLCYILLYLL